MRKFTFQKDEDNRWYVVLPEWTGDRSDLEMVQGADIFLDIIAKGRTSIKVKISLEPFEESKYTLTFVNHEGGGGTYHLESGEFDLTVWLCHVIEFVFGNIPQKIYIG